MWRQWSARVFIGARVLSLVAVLALVALALSSASRTLAPAPPRAAQEVEAPDTGSAVLAAHSQGSRVEVADLRSPTREVFANRMGR